MTVSIASAPWLGDAALQTLLDVLNRHGEEARIAGGAVRNALLGVPAKDIDIATTARPEEVIRRAAGAGYRTVPTGIEHGTVTVIAGGRPYEVTTLREDVETDGRRAVVRFGRSWEADARRRDFTMNGLYACADGSVVDYVGGVADLAARRLRFIGKAEERIREDYLRILRFFRFFAWYGEGRPDEEGIKACARLKAGLDGLSAERVWAELKLLLSADNPSRALLWMRQTGVLTRVLPESERWGIDLLLDLIPAENAFDWSADPLLRLQAVLPPRAKVIENVSTRLRLSRAESERLKGWSATASIDPETDAQTFRQMLYRGNAQAIEDRLRLDLASAHAGGRRETCAALQQLLELLENWIAPKFPLSGQDLLGLSLKPGPQMGQLLAALEAEWLSSDFSLGRDALLERARQCLEAGSSGNQAD